LNKERFDKLVDLFLEGEFPKEMISKKRGDLERVIKDLGNIRTLIQGDLQLNGLSDEEVLELKEFVDLVRDGIKTSDFETKQNIINLMDVRGKLALENKEKAVCLSCKLEKQKQPPTRTSHSLNNHNRTHITLRERLVIDN